MACALTWLDVFTSKPFAGNALAVVHDADGLGDDTMLAFARETRLSETTFVQSPTEPSADYRNRIWMPTGELPFAGHPTLGTAVAVARQRRGEGPREVSYVQQTPSGLQPIDVELHDELLARATMLQEPADLRGAVDPEPALLALGLDRSDLDPELGVHVASTGIRHLLVALRDAALLDRPRPDFAALTAALEDVEALTAYVFAFDGGERAQARAFFLGPAGVLEDAATGSAAGALCASLHDRAGAARLTVEQGASVGRAGRIACEPGERVRVAGDVRLVAEGVAHL